MIPAGAVRELATVHYEFGVIYRLKGQIETASHHYGKSIRHEQSIQNRFGAGQSRRSIRSFFDAREWAHCTDAIRIPILRDNPNQPLGIGRSALAEAALFDCGKEQRRLAFDGHPRIVFVHDNERSIR